MPSETRTARIFNSAAQAAPVDLAAEQIDPRVLEALSRWRDADPHSLSALASVLTTHSGNPAADSLGYMSALHGFVAEQITVDKFSASHVVVFPHATTVPGWDLIVDGHPVQVKEGANAYELVHHALERYPHIRSFATDPATAARLKAEGIDAVGVSGLEPAHIAHITGESVGGIDALADAGALHVPVLTTIFSICRYWERFDSEKSDGVSALRNAALDVGAQALGTAAGLKIAAIAVVASSTFAIAALPLTAAAIIGAIGARRALDHVRNRRLRGLIESLDETRRSAEVASEITLALSREQLIKRLRAIDPRRHDLIKEARLEVITEYVILLDRLGIIAKRVADALADVQQEADRNGVVLAI